MAAIKVQSQNVPEGHNIHERANSAVQNDRAPKLALLYNFFIKINNIWHKAYIVNFYKKKYYNTKQNFRVPCVPFSQVFEQHHCT